MRAVGGGESLGDVDALGQSTGIVLDKKRRYRRGQVLRGEGGVGSTITRTGVWGAPGFGRAIDVVASRQARASSLAHVGRSGYFTITFAATATGELRWRLLV
jgi:hypothetical protein